jgi:release factor glutamine methyltransferase
MQIRTDVVETVLATHHSDVMNAQVHRILREARDQLVAARIVGDAAEARLEAEVLLYHAMGVDRATLYSGLTPPPPTSTVALFESLMARRLSGEPVAYITGTREFYGLTFRVGPGVLIPRPETELLVERALAAVSQVARPAIADIGCGSGCVGIALAAHLPGASVWAIDLSEAAVASASENAARHGLSGRVTTLHGDLLAPLPARVNLIVANLPYINARDLANLPASIARFEPLLALDGGASGLDHIQRLVDQAPPCLCPGGSLLLEVGYDQAGAVAELLRPRFPGATVGSWRDLGGHIRVVGAQSSAPEFPVPIAPRQ